jgi:hypothetical protein
LPGEPAGAELAPPAEPLGCAALPPLACCTARRSLLSACALRCSASSLPIGTSVKVPLTMTILLILSGTSVICPSTTAFVVAADDARLLANLAAGVSSRAAEIERTEDDSVTFFFAGDGALLGRASLLTPFGRLCCGCPAQHGRHFARQPWFGAPIAE